MNINGNFVKGLGLVFAAGFGGGWIAQRIANRKNDKKLKEYEEALEKLRTDTAERLSAMHKNAEMEMSAEARRIITNEIDTFGRSELRNEVINRVKTVDTTKLAEGAAIEGTRRMIEEVTREITKDAKSELRDVIQETAKETIESNLKDEMYKVNSRRIIEDAVDRAVRDEVSRTVRDKLKWFSANDLKNFLL